MPVCELGINVGEREVFKLAMSEEGASEGVHSALVQVTPEEMVLERVPIHHGRENVGHGRVG